MKRTLSVLFMVLHVCLCSAQYLVQSPNEKLSVTLHTNKSRKGASKFLVPTKMTMKVFNESEVLVNNEIGMTVKSKGHRYSFGKLDIVHANKGAKLTDHPDTKDTLLSDLNGRYNNIILATKEGIVLEVRVYNDGVAYRFKVLGHPEDYKILEVCDVFPGEKPIAILGTFEGEYTFPWRTMKVTETYSQDGRPKTSLSTKSPATKGGTRFIPWKDALSSFSVGISFDWHSGDTWGDFSDSQSFRADFTYKHIYGGINFTSCHQIQYIPWGESFWPFEEVIAGIDSWTVGARAGYCLPLQNGYEIWNIIPYMATSLMHLHQHGEIRVGCKPLDKHNHWLVGPGIKVQCTHREGIMLGIGYEYLFFTDRKAPDGMNAITLSIGRTF